MDSPEIPSDLYAFIAATADLCLKPWKHAVVSQNLLTSKSIQTDEPLELVISIECRNLEGERLPENDLDLEIYRSGTDSNLMVGWSNQLDLPLLWQGKHSVWMDGNNGKRCQVPRGGERLESFARRLRALLVQPED